jgi:hypothetical protein
MGQCHHQLSPRLRQQLVVGERDFNTADDV